MAELNCVDMSRWGGELTDDEARCMWDSGIRHIIVGTGNPFGAGLYSKQQAEKWLAINPEGTVDAYIYLYMAGSASQSVTEALQTLSGVPIRLWWLDAEDVDSPELTPQARADFLNLCLDTLGSDREKGIYSGQWWWRPYMNNSDEFSYLPLWNSYYDGDPDEDGLPYGGWYHSAIEQYGGTQIVCGQSVDINYAKNLEDAMTVVELNAKLEELNAAITKRDQIIGLAKGDYTMAMVAWDLLKSHGLI